MLWLTLNQVIVTYGQRIQVMDTRVRRWTQGNWTCCSAALNAAEVVCIHTACLVFSLLLRHGNVNLWTMWTGSGQVCCISASLPHNPCKYPREITAGDQSVSNCDHRSAQWLQFWTRTWRMNNVNVSVSHFGSVCQCQNIFLTHSVQNWRQTSNINTQAGSEQFTRWCSLKFGGRIQIFTIHDQKRRWLNKSLGEAQNSMMIPERGPGGMRILSPKVQKLNQMTSYVLYISLLVAAVPGLHFLDYF